MTTDAFDEAFERHWAAMPEGKLELIGGQLLISTLAGSRWIMHAILADYGPGMVLPMASSALWWSALEAAFRPQPQPLTSAEWHAWAEPLEYTPEVAPAGPRGTSRHRQLYDVLQSGLYHCGEITGLGFPLGPDSVIRLGEDGLTPDLIFIDRSALNRLRARYLEGPPPIAIEIVMPGSEDQDRVLKRRLYEEARVPEYWRLEPELLQVTFHRLEPGGGYRALEIGRPELTRIVETKEDYIYTSSAVPELSLSLLKLWTSAGSSRENPWSPFLPIDTRLEDRGRLPHGSGGIQWDEIPFAPRVALHPVPIRFDEYVSWCGRARFESYSGGLKIDGMEGTRRVAGMLLMTFGLTEVVRLAHPREWITFLDRDRYTAVVRQEAERFLPGAQYECRSSRKGESYFRGELPLIPDLDVYEESLEACERALRQAVEEWILLRIARREPVPECE